MVIQTNYKIFLVDDTPYPLKIIEFKLFIIVSAH